MTTFQKYSFVWITAVFFVLSFIGHWTFGWFAYLQEQQEHGQIAVVSDYVVEMSRDTFENWQSEFLQLIWQVAGLSFLLYVGSPQSKEGSDRSEEKLDYLIKKISPEDGDDIIKRLDKKYSRE